MSVKSLDKLICGLCCQGWTFMFKERGAVFVSYWNSCVIIGTHRRRYCVWFNCPNSDRRMRRMSSKLASPVSVTPLKGAFTANLSHLLSVEPRGRPHNWGVSPWKCLGLLPIEHFVCDIKEDKLRTGFYDCKYVISAWFQRLSYC